MLDSLVKAAEKLAELLQYREKRKRIRFDTFVSPMFGVLSQVHSDYVAMLERCLAGLENDVDYEQIIRQFAVERVANEPLRRDLAARVKVLADEGHDLNFPEFFLAVSRYLTLPTYRDRKAIQRRLERNWKGGERNIHRLSGSFSLYIAIVDAWRADEAEQLFQIHTKEPRRNDVKLLVDSMLCDLADRWQHVVSVHAMSQLRAHR